MFKKFLSAIILVFAFLFLNVSEVKAVENTSGLPDEVFANAGIGTKLQYWAVVNYGEDYIDDKNIVIDLDKDAISNLDIKYILIDETNCVGSGNDCTGEGTSVYYKRNVDKQFSSRIEYTLKNGYVGEKSVTIFLLRDLSNDPSDSLIVDKIYVPINQKRRIEEIDVSKIIVTQTLTANNVSSIVNVTLADEEMDNYVLKNVKYRYEEDSSSLNALEKDLNEFEFTAYQNGEYEIIVEDVFGSTKTIVIEVSGIAEPPVVIEAIPTVITPTNSQYDVTINLYKIVGENRVEINPSDLFESDTLTYEFNGTTEPIKDKVKEGNFYMTVNDNGTYVIKANVNNSQSELVLIIDNIDREKPFIEVGNNLIVYTESIDLFNPRNEIFAYDNMTSGEVLMDDDHLNISYYYLDDDGNKVDLDSYYDHLYSVREIYVSYTVTDEAGNPSSGECLVTPIDDTKPTISHSSRKLILYINDEISENRIKTHFKLKENDNSLYEGSNRQIQFTMTWDLATITDTNGRIRVSELTKNGRIFVKAVDEAGNESDEIVLPVEVCERLIKIEAKQYQYAVYGEYSPQNNPILYHCLDYLRDEFGDLIYDENGEPIPGYTECNFLLLEGDKLIGSLYIENVKDVDKYEIKYDKINVPSKLYSLDYGDNFEDITFEIVARKLKVVTEPKGKLYLDKDPNFTYHIDDSVCGLTIEEEQEIYKAYYDELLEQGYTLSELNKIFFDGDIYRCSEVTGDKLKGSLVRYEGKPWDLEGYEGVYYYEVDGVDFKEFVWYKLDEDGNEVVVSRPIMNPGKENGGLYVDCGQGSENNYKIEFIEGLFTIYSRSVTIDINSKEKIYGENDPVFDIGECEIVIYVGDKDPDAIKDGYTAIADCTKELGISLSRQEGETVLGGPYEIIGNWTNRNYFVTFISGYLTITTRDLNLRAKGDEGTPGIYTITYEDNLPTIVVIDEYKDVEGKGIASNPSIGIADKLKEPLEFEVYDSYGNKLTYGLDGLPNYAADNTYYIKFKQDSIIVVDKDNNDAGSNYKIGLDDYIGEIKVIKKDIYLIVKQNPAGSRFDLLRKTYGDEDVTYNSGHLEAMFPSQKHIILDANNKFFIEVANEVTLNNGEIYIPRDNATMKYYLVRDEGIYVGQYKINLDKTDGCDNYNVYLQEEVYTIIERNIKIVIGRQEIVYRDEEPISDFTYDEDLAKSSLQYDDKLVGKPNVVAMSGCYVGIKPNGSDLPYCNVGEYKIGQGSITVVDGNDETIDLGYNYEVTEGAIVVNQREIEIIAQSNEKLYGNPDPNFTFIVTHNGVEEELPADQYTGKLGRESGYNDVEIPREQAYPLTQGTLKIKNHGTEVKPIENYLIINWDLNAGLTIKKRNITITANSATLMYGADYTQQLGYKRTGDGIATNNQIVVGINNIDGSNITLEDHVEGGVRIVNGPVDRAGVYIVSCDDIKIVRYINNDTIDVSDYYNITREEGTLTITPRYLTIKVNNGLTKVYGNEDPNWSDLSSLITVSCQGAEKCLVEEDDKLVGYLIREEGEDVGSYKINISDLRVERGENADKEDMSESYTLELSGSPVFIITERHLIIEAIDVNITYGDEIKLEYTIGGDHGLALRDRDSLKGKLTLSPDYEGCGVYHSDTYKDSDIICGSYEITKGTLTFNNEHNYNADWFIPGVLTVTRRVVRIIPVEEYLYKVYGNPDPVFRYTLSYPVPSGDISGSLNRELGENVGYKYYKIKKDNIKHTDDYHVILEDAYFTINPRELKIEVLPDLGKIYLSDDPEWKDWESLTKVTGTLAFNDKISGRLEREEGEEVGTYKITGNNLRVSDGNGGNNYNLAFVGGTFLIYYDNIKSLKIIPITNNKYQVNGNTSPVQVKAEFNQGANPSYLDDVVWSVVKRLGNGDELDWSGEDKMIRNLVTNEVTVIPEGIGVYLIKAKYGTFEDIYEVYVETSTVRNVYIHWVSGDVNQILGAEKPVTYGYTFTGEVRENTNVRWYVNDKLIKEANANDYETFTYTPNGKGVYEVYAMIIDKTSERLTINVANNNAPVIKLLVTPVEYIEAKSGKAYVDEGFGHTFTVEDDITSYEWLEAHKFIPVGIDSVNINVKGVYYVRYDAVDEHGNYAISVYRQIVVQDTTPPTITLKECADGSINVTLLYGQNYVDCGAVARDNYDEGELEIYVTNPVNVNKIGEYTVTYMAYDSSGNVAIAERKVKIIDNISPRITLIGDETIYLEVNIDSFVDQGARVVDNVDGTFIIYATSIFYKGEKVDKVDASKLGEYTVRYDYTDTAGNIGSGRVRRVIVQDTTAPVITLKGNNPYIVRYSYPNINFVDPGAIVTDNYDKDVQYTVSGTIGDELGTYYLEYNAVDSQKNRAETVVRQIVVVDVRNPILSFKDEEMCPQYMTIEALYEEYDRRCDIAGFGIEIDDDYTEEKDDLYKRLVVTGSVDSTTVGTYIISYDVIDMAGNAAVTLNRYVRVVDTTAPEITLIGGDADGSVTVEVFEDYIEYGANFYDRYDLYHGIEIKTTILPDVNSNILGEYKVYYDAVDSNGNVAQQVVRKVYVKDTTPPVITLHGKNPDTIERGNPYIESWATVIDNYDGPINNYTISNAPSGMNLGVYEVVYRAIDSSGNIGEAIRIVNVVDTIPPIVLGVEDGMYYRNPVSIYFIPTLGTNETLRGWLNNKEITSPWYVEDEGEYELHVEDDAGNSVDIWFAIDTTPPQILGVRNGEYTNKETVEIYSNEKIKYYSYRYQSGDWLTSEDQRVYFTKEGLYRIYAVDMAGNISETVMFVVDKTPPIYSLTGVEQKGIAANNVSLIVENNASVIVNSMYNIDNNYTFANDGYYQVAIRDLAGNVVNLQFVINKTKSVVVNGELINLITQHSANNKIQISGTNYPRDSGYMLVKPLIDGGFEYVKGKLFSEEEYQKLINGETIEYEVSETDDTYMFVAFVVNSEELNKFGTQTVEDDEDDDDSALLAAVLFIAVAAVGGWFFLFFLRRRREEEEEEEEEVIVDDY